MGKYKLTLELANMTLWEKINAIQNSEELSDIEKQEQINAIYEEFDKAEQMIKDNQSAFTKAQQEKIELAKILVEENPANVERISDEKVRRKILQEKYGVDSLEELKIMFPDYAKSEKPDDEEEEDELKKLQQKVRLMEHNNTKTKINEAVEEAINWEYKDVISTIPDFQDKLNLELSNLSDKLPPKERVNRALKLVVGGNISTANLYAMMQGITPPSSQTDWEDDGWNIDESPLAKAFRSNIK